MGEHGSREYRHMTENIKRHATTAAGYIYQNRQGLKVLCDWLDAPTRYNQVKFECDEEVDAPEALDDIVIVRRDGLTDLQQVKFTPNADKHLLCWDWMLERTGKTERSRSMLKKWFDAYASLDKSKVGEISLITNRRPDASIEACLVDNKIRLDQISKEDQKKILAQIGSEDACRAFFDQLIIYHSDKGYSALEHELDARLLKHGIPEGIATLKSVALNWAIQKRSPAPDGWIHLDLVRSILQAVPPKPLPEDFAVPKGYEVPDKIFHQEFVEAIVTSRGKPVVLTGPPGRGKSTYLSALCDVLAGKKIPTVRHHYFLSTTERGRDRLHSHVVEQSIQAQVKRLNENLSIPGDLRSTVELCAEYYQKQGIPFVLILDGLDHVWRSNSADKRPLDDLFSQLIPCPNNMVLLVGTQPVDDVQLPIDLLADSPRSEWLTLPAMSESAVFSFLKRAVGEGRLATPRADEQQRELREAAISLCLKTNGHPLHVIYATSELECTHRRISRWDVGQLKGDLTRDARFYYASLWGRLPPSLKDVLRLVCGFHYFWPKTAFSQIAQQTQLADPDVRKVEHLLHSSAAGLKVFHESLAVFVRSTDGYNDRIQELMPAVEEWLKTSAPDSLRVNWLWTIQAKLGNPENLIKRLNRDWIMQRLEEGYPESLFEILLNESMDCALQAYEFSDAYRLAHLKERMVGGREFQMDSDDVARLIFYTLALTENESVLTEAYASRHELNILHLVALGMALHFRGSQSMAEICGEEAYRRYRALAKFNPEALSKEFDFLIEAFSTLGVFGDEPEDVTDFISQNSPNIWKPLAQIQIDNGCLDGLMDAMRLLESEEGRNIFSDTCVRAMAIAGVSISDRDDCDDLAWTPLVASVGTAHSRCSTYLNQPIPVGWLDIADLYERKDRLANLVHHWFFSGIHISLCMLAEGKQEFELTHAPVFHERENISGYLNGLNKVARDVANLWWQGEFVEFHKLFELFEIVPDREFRQGYMQMSAMEDFKAALHLVANDIHLVSVLLCDRPDSELTKETIMTVKDFHWFDRASFRAQYAAGKLTALTDEAAQAFMEEEQASFAAEVQDETSVYLQIPLQLCAISIRHRFAKKAKIYSKQVWELTTGFGHRKDPALNNALEAIEYLVEVAPDNARRLLGSVAPQVHHILKYTDGKGTRHVLSQADRLLAKLKPSALVVKYAEHTDAGDWSLAESSLEAYVEQGGKEGWSLDALMRTGLHLDIRDTLLALPLSQQNNSDHTLSVLQNHNGWDFGVIQPKKPTYSNSNKNPYARDFTTFSPKQLDDFLNDLADVDYNERKSLLRSWYQHWSTQGENKQLLSILEGLLWSEEGRNKDILCLSDLVFESRRKLSGVKVKATWNHLVKAQILKGGWIGYSENTEQICQRLDQVARYFPKRCDEFVSATTYPMFEYPGAWRLPPNELMVYFYVKQGHIDKAIEFARAMVDCVLEDTRTLPLETPSWGIELLANMDVKNNE